MLHKVNQPKCHLELRELLGFQKEVLRFALSTSLPLNKEKFHNFFGKQTGAWLWKRTYRKQYTNFGNNFNALVKYARANQNEIKDVFSAFCNDILFADKWRYPAFQFRYSSLPETWQDVLKPFLISFYERFEDEKGYPKDIFDWPCGNLSRANLMRHYQEAGNKVCPYCDGPEGDFTDEKDANDADHLLPKAIYPSLSIHWANLFRACMACNERYKLASDPIDPHGPGELDSIYHPFYAPAYPGIHIKVEQHPGNSNHYKLSLDDFNHPQRSANLDRILNLSQRWTTRINRNLEMDKSSLAA